MLYCALRDRLLQPLPPAGVELAEVVREGLGGYNILYYDT